MKESFEELLAGRNIITQIDEQIVYNRLDLDENAIWSLFLASGYLKIVNEGSGDASSVGGRNCMSYQQTLRVMVMFRSCVIGLL
ncbi:MAG: hypothetical protein ACLTKE_11095 [Coprococcus sp.]